MEVPQSQREAVSTRVDHLTIDRLRWLAEKLSCRAEVTFDEIQSMAREVLRLRCRRSIGRDVDDALDAAGAPHCDERGSLTTAKRVEWLAGQRDA